MRRGSLVKRLIRAILLTIMKLENHSNASPNGGYPLFLLLKTCTYLQQDEYSLTMLQ